MKIIPAVDIYNGQVVRLRKGNFANQSIYGSDPTATVASWLDRGAELVHVVDLNAAKAQGSNSHIINDILSCYGHKIQVAGGIKSRQRAEELLAQGANRIVIGTAAVELCGWVKDLLSQNAARAVIALDIRFGIVHTCGWLKKSDKKLEHLLNTLLSWSADKFLITDIEKDGTNIGANVLLYSHLQKKYPQTKFIASGGVNSIENLAELKKAGVTEVVIGKALYSNGLNLGEAIELGANPDAY